jgi:hypothetical protein
MLQEVVDTSNSIARPAILKVAVLAKIYTVLELILGWGY